MNVLVAQVGPAGKVPLKRPLTINVVDEVTLPDANSDEGLFARLILHETETPSYPSYNLDDARKVMNYIRIAVDNRRFRRPDIFGFQPTPVPTPLKVITATTVVHHKHGPASVLRQFEGLSTYPNLQPKDTKNFEECVRLANDDANAQQPAFAAHVQAALDVANAKQAQPDPSKNGLYGWMTEGSGPPGKFQVAYASLLGITFYTITDEAATPPSAVHAHRAAQPKPR
jgi:hypothetical protein